MKNIKTFEEFIVEDANTAINQIGNDAQKKQDINSDRNKTQQQKDKEYQDKTKKRVNLKVGELQKKVETEINQKQQTVNQDLEKLKRDQAYLRPENQTDAKNFDNDQKTQLKSIESELDNAATQRELIKKQTDEIKKNF